MLISDDTGRIRHISCKHVGSVHDSFVLQDSAVYQDLRHGVFGNGILLADAGYPNEKFLLKCDLSPSTPAEKR